MMEFNTTPDWVKNAVFYQIFPDRFAKSKWIEKPDNFESWESAPTVHGFKGGDLLGVYEKLDYLQDLGISAVYFNPIFQSASNHRYHTHDYYTVDPLLGGNKAFEILLKEAHKRNIRIILDGVFNHASRGFFQFNHILETGEKSPYLNWFNIHSYPLNAYQGKPNYQCWWGAPALPEFNTDNNQVRRYLFDVARYWVDQGIDGWRLDVPFNIDDDDFWREFRRTVKEANPDAYIVGEIPSEAQRWMKGDMFDAVMNYQFTIACLSFFGGQNINFLLAEGMMGFSNVRTLDTEMFSKRSIELINLYPRDFSLAQLNLLDSHDMPRFLSLVNGNKDAFLLATLFQMTYPGAPCIYYGDEIGLTGGKDPDCRKAFPWDESKWDHDLRNQIKTYIQLRQAHPALRTGDYIPLFAESGILAFMRKDDKESLIIIINTSAAAYNIDIPIKDLLTEGTVLKDQLSDKNATIQGNHLRDLSLPPYRGVVLA